MRKASRSQGTGGVGAQWMVILLLALVALVPACKRSEQGQLPAVSGEAIKAKREEIKGFGLARAYPDQSKDSLALALEFSRPLVGTQDFDKLLTFAPGAVDKGSWSLDDDGKTLRFPFVQPNATYTVRISGKLTAADGSGARPRHRGEGVHRRTRPRGRLRLAGQRAAGAGEPRPAGGIGECRGSRRRIPARARRLAAEVLRRVPARRTQGQLGAGQRLRRQGAARQARQAGLRQPLRARRQAQRAHADLPAGAGHRRTAGAWPVLRGDEEDRPVQGRVRDRVLHRQRHRPAHARLQGQAVRAYGVARERRAGQHGRAEGARRPGRGDPEGQHRPARQRAAQLQARQRARAGRDARAATSRCCRSTSRRWTCPSSRSPAANRPGSTSSRGRAAICTGLAKRCACRRCCATTTASRWPRRARPRNPCSCG